MKKMTLIHAGLFAAGAALGYFICKKQTKNFANLMSKDGMRVGKSENCPQDLIKYHLKSDPNYYFCMNQGFSPSSNVEKIERIYH